MISEAKNEICELIKKEFDINLPTTLRASQSVK